MNKAVAFCLGHIAVNLAIGIMLVFFPVFLQIGATGPFVYDSTVNSEFNSSASSSISPGGEVEDAGDASYRLLDLLSIGMIFRFLEVVDNFMFGLYNMLYSSLGALMEPAQRTFLFGAIRGIIVIIYILTAIQWWTSRNPTET